jgi:hypothetical protein
VVEGGVTMAHERKPSSRWCVELLAVAFGDTIVDVGHVGEDAPAYRIGEGEAVRVPVCGDGLPDSAGFALVQARAGGFWLAFTPSMRGVVLDRGGRRPLEQLVAEGRAVAADNAHHFLLEEGETVWVEHSGVRFRARLVPREAVRASARTVDRPYQGSLGASAALGLVFLMLMHVQPASLVIEDEHAELARLLQLEPEQLEPERSEPVSGSPSETARSAGLGVEDRAAASTPRPRPPDPRARSSKRERPLWVPAGPAQAVGQLGRSYDPVEAARHAGILGELGGRSFAGERVFEPERDDAQLWASAAEVRPTWMASFGYHSGSRAPRLGGGSFGDLRSSTGEGVVGWGSYGSMHRLGRWRERAEEDPEAAALCSGDCRRSVRPPRPTIVRVGRVEVGGATDRDLARRIVRAHANELRLCFDQTITEREAAFEGEVELSLVRGKVGAVVTDPAFPGDLGGCMKRMIRRWRFPVGSSPETDLLTVSLRLSR